MTVTGIKCITFKHVEGNEGLMIVCWYCRLFFAVLFQFENIHDVSFWLGMISHIPLFCANLKRN